jgi:hypothetical protein
MKIGSVFAALVALATSTVCNLAWAADAPSDSKPILYTDPGRTSFERFEQDEKNKQVVLWVGGNFTPKHRSTTREQDALYDEFSSVPLDDCSDEKFKCVYGLYRVFAVPRSGLAPSSVYSVGGADFRVEQCLKAKGDHCKVALIRSECQSKGEPSRCVPVSGGRAASPAPGPILFFVFTDDVGITGYGSIDEPADEKKDPVTIAGKMHLRSRKGLLGNGSLAPVR